MNLSDAVLDLIKKLNRRTSIATMIDDPTLGSRVLGAVILDAALEGGLVDLHPHSAQCSRTAKASDLIDRNIDEITFPAATKPLDGHWLSAFDPSGALVPNHAFHDLIPPALAMYGAGTFALSKSPQWWQGKQTIYGNGRSAIVLYYRDSISGSAIRVPVERAIDNGELIVKLGAVEKAPGRHIHPGTISLSAGLSMLIAGDLASITWRGEGTPKFSIESIDNDVFAQALVNVTRSNIELDHISYPKPNPKMAASLFGM